MSKIFFFIALPLFLFLLQVGFISALPYPLNSLNLVLSVIIFFTVLINYQTALWLAFISGVFLDLFSPLFWGAVTGAFLLTVILTNLVFNYIFTNRSIYSLMVLALFGTFINAFVISFFIFYAADYYQLAWFKIFLWQPLFNLIFLVVLFQAVNFTTKKFKSVFLFPY